jgi:hypothetical protein
MSSRSPRSFSRPPTPGPPTETMTPA